MQVFNKCKKRAPSFSCLMYNTKKRIANSDLSRAYLGRLNVRILTLLILTVLIFIKKCPFSQVYQF